MTHTELNEVCKLTAELTQQKLKVTPQLDVGNFASKCFGQLLGELKMHNEGMFRIEQFNADDLKLNI